MVGLAHLNEVCNLSEANQFQWKNGRMLSNFECGYYACLMAKSMAPNGQHPSLTAQQVSDQAQSWYIKYNGDNSGANMLGMSLPQEYDLLQHLGLHYQGIDMTVAMITSWIKARYLVIVAIGEASAVDEQVGGNPYPWRAAGNHVIVLTGIDGDNFLVRDSANCTNLYDPSSLRPGPRRYVANQLTFVSATAIVPPWKPRPTGTTPPTGEDMSLTKDWHDDGKTLTHLPSKHFFKAGFRQLALDSMAKGEDPAGWAPLEEEHPANPVELHNAGSGQGSTQLTASFKLIWTQKNGVHRSAAGLELMECYKEIAALKVLESKLPPTKP